MAALCSMLPPAAQAQDWKITIPTRSELTPVQRLNRQGVEAVNRKQYEKAEQLFYKAYLFDPADPFTLNNLGYVAELEGQLDRALKFYGLSERQSSNAAVDLSSERQMQGKPMRLVFSSLKDAPLRTNRMNIEAMHLLSEGQSDQAAALLRQALRLAPSDAFTLNNLGVAEELTGDYESALKYYDAAAAAHSAEPIVVSLNNASRGKPLSEVAARSAAELRMRIATMSGPEEKAEMLTVRGVSAVNRNDWATARQAFLEAYKLNPDNAFVLNNRGYVAEKDGDRETAELYYAQAAKARNANGRIGLATVQAAQGERLAPVALHSDAEVEASMEEDQQMRRQQARPLELKRRPPTATSPAPPATSAPSSPPQP